MKRMLISVGEKKYDYEAVQEDFTCTQDYS